MAVMKEDHCASAGLNNQPDKMQAQKDAAVPLRRQVDCKNQVVFFLKSCSGLDSLVRTVSCFWLCAALTTTPKTPQKALSSSSLNPISSIEDKQPSTLTSGSLWPRKTPSSDNSTVTRSTQNYEGALPPSTNPNPPLIVSANKAARRPRRSCRTQTDGR